LLAKVNQAAVFPDAAMECWTPTQQQPRRPTRLADSGRRARRSGTLDLDVGLDLTGFAYDAEAEIAAHAARLGYGRIWVGSIGDPFQTCALRWAASRAARPGGIGTAIGVVPLGTQTPASLAASAAALTRLTGGRFALGVGAGSAYEPAFRRTWGIDEVSSLALVRAYLQTIRGLLSGQSVTFRGSGINYDRARLSAAPADTPLFLGAAGPEMTKLGGELADGVYLSWCTPDAVAQARACIAAGAARAGRDPRQVTLAASARVCIDDDPATARRALAGALVHYVTGWSGERPRAFRASFTRMGYGTEIAEVDQLAERGAGHEEIIEAFPERMLRGLGYFGPAPGAAEAVRRQVAGADIAVVRVVPSRPGTDAIHAILEACRPAGDR
jgi:alkanesulfonate monooxygenase SsuD/methylene tetrahydromethanopterin reductase-like flavin-dependent oxidoreductase (luciferase family)